jgi:hypothetical protein
VDERSDGSDGVICGLGAPDSVDALARTSHAGRHILLRGSSSAFATLSRQLDPDGPTPPATHRMDRRSPAPRRTWRPSRPAER